MSVDKSMVSLQIDKELLDAINKAAARRGITRSAFVRKALTRVMEGEPRVVTSRPKGSTSAS